MDRWENELCFRSTDRVVRPFEWGLEHAEDWPIEADRNGHSEHDWLKELNQRAIASSSEFFSYEPPADFNKFWKSLK